MPTVSDDIALICPACRKPLHASGGEFTCAACGAIYPAVLSIPDLRTFDPPYATREEDLARAEALAARYEELNYRDLLHWAFIELHPELDAEQREHLVDGRLKRPQINRARWELVQGLMARLGLVVADAPALDVGCGTGGFVAELAAIFPRAVGADIVMEELVLAHKYLSEQGFENFRLVCCGAEQLPFASGAFGLISATDVIEHLADQERALCALYDALVDNGMLCFNSPNRFDPIHPEPHVGVRWVGFLPRVLQEPYVRWRSGKDYKGKRLLALGELQRMLANIVQNGSYVVFYWPRWHQGDPGRTMVGRWLRRMPQVMVALNRLWAHFVSSYEVIIWKAIGECQVVSSSRIRPMCVEI